MGWRGGELMTEVLATLPLPVARFLSNSMILCCKGSHCDFAASRGVVTSEGLPGDDFSVEACQGCFQGVLDALLLSSN